MVYQHPSSPDRLSATFAALADPTRRAILASLIAGEATVQQLAKPFSMSMPAISKHLKVLEKAGLIARSREAQWRPCRLEAAPLKDVAEWAEDFRRFWDESFDRLDAYLQVMKAKENGSKETPSREMQKKEKRHVRKK
jgi:DNA-binding transcriptional ArsR family regulator